ncbi:hypothetical protein Q8A73_000052 [Channa argus]|nr:hypothetical protein Q8A73_000052 [Channa argus]
MFITLTAFLLVWHRVQSGDEQDYRANLRRGIKRAKHCYKLKVEEHFSNSDPPRLMWQDIQAITDCKPSKPTPTSTDVSFLTDLNHCLDACFDRDNNETATKTTPSADHQPPTDVYHSHLLPVHGSSSIIKFAAYRDEVQHLAAWCVDKNLFLNSTKTKELIVDFRRENGGKHDPIQINGMAVEHVASFKFLGTHITKDLSYTTNTSSLVKKTHRRLS